MIKGYLGGSCVWVYLYETFLVHVHHEYFSTLQKDASDKSCPATGATRRSISGIQPGGDGLGTGGRCCTNPCNRLS